MGGKRPADGAGAEGGKGGGKRSKFSSTNYSGSHALPYGKQGILITLENADPNKASKEALLVLGEIYDQLDPMPVADPAEEEAEEATDFSKAIESEVTGLKDKRGKRFKMHDTGLRNCMFIEMRVDAGKPGPCEVVLKLLRNAMETKQCQFRYCMRFLPCTHCESSNADHLKAFAEKTVKDIIDCSPTAEPTTVAVLYEHRAATMDRMTLINMFIDHVPCPPHKVQLKDAKKTISVQMIRNAIGVAALEDYHLLHRYNVKHICNPPEPTDASKKQSAAAKASNDASKTAAAATSKDESKPADTAAASKDDAAKPASAVSAEDAAKPAADASAAEEKTTVAAAEASAPDAKAADVDAKEAAATPAK